MKLDIFHLFERFSLHHQGCCTSVGSVTAVSSPRLRSKTWLQASKIASAIQSSAPEQTEQENRKDPPCLDGTHLYPRIS